MRMFLLLLLLYVDHLLLHKRPLIIFRVNFALGTSYSIVDSVTQHV